ncbi:unnamed protein product [Rhodiola kirilowii]
MSPSGPPNPNGGNKSLSSSLRRSTSGYLVSQGSPLTSQTASATALSRQIQFNGMNMLGNGPNAPSRLNQSFGNGGSGVSHRASMSPEAESDPLSNRMAFVSSSFISADAGNNRISNQVQSQSFQSSVGNQMLPDQQEWYQQPQSQDSQSLQYNQQLSLQYFSATHNGYHRDLPQSYQRNRSVFLPVNFEQKSGSDFHGQPFWNDSAKLEPHTHSMRGLAPAKAKPHQSDQSLFIQQQQQQLLHLSRQPPLKTSVAQMDIMNQHRLLQLQEQEQQHLGVIPQQQMSQLHQQFPTQNLSLLDPENPPYKPGTCARRLTQFMYHQRHRPLDNNIDFWRQFVSEFFAPHAKMKWCVSMYESGRPISHVFRQDVWHCGICNRNPGRGFEATAVVLSRLFKVKYESGTFEELLYVEMPHEEHDSASGQTILHCAKATHESVFDQLRVVRDGQLRIVFSADLKICSWEFCTRRHEELIPRGVLLPLVRRLGAAARKYHDASQKSNPSLSAPKLQSNCNTFVSSARNSAKSLDVPLVNDLGYTRRYLRFLQISEVVNSMVDLIDYSRETGTGPMESLVRFPRRTNSSAHGNGPSQHGEDGQPLPQQLQPITTTLRNNDSDQGLQQAASNGALSAGSILSSPTSLNTGPQLLHRNSANSRRQNSLCNGRSSYRAGRHQAFDPSNTLAQVHSTVAPSNNPQTMSSDSVPLPAPEADGNESQRSVQNLYRKRRR